MHALLLVGLVACAPDGRGKDTAAQNDDSSGGADTDDAADDSGDDPGDTGDTDEWDQSKVLGTQATPFALVDLNPNSATFEQMVSSTDLEGRAYALVFLDSRCLECREVAVDLWGAYQAHPEWWTAMPTYAIERDSILGFGGLTVDYFVDGHAMPYLYDTEELNLWSAYMALNHDFFAVSEEGVVTDWLELYYWPDDFALFTDLMTERFGG
jgi:hypothetical protein